MVIPSIRNFSREAHDHKHYARLDGDWSVAVADVISSTSLVAQGHDREINFIAGAMVAVMTATMGTEETPCACQFGGDGAVALIPPQKTEYAAQILQALAHWAKEDFGIPLRVGMVPVKALDAEGHETFAALHDFGNGNVFGLFLGSGVPTAETWVKADAQWRLDPAPGPLPGLEELSCRWRPVPSGRGTVLCLIIDPVEQGTADQLLSEIERELGTIVPPAKAAPLGNQEQLTVSLPSIHALKTELTTVTGWAKVPRLLRALIGMIVMGVVQWTKDQKIGWLDVAAYKRSLSERSDYRKMAGGVRMILDVSSDEADKIEIMLSRFENQGLIHFGTARSDATVMTCLVGNFAADRHIHFVDGDGLGYWRAATVLKAKLKANV